MLRSFLVALCLSIPSLAMAADAKFHVNVDAQITAGGETTEMQARLAGEMGKPLSIQINDQAEIKIEATFTPIAAAPDQYKAEVTITRNGKVVSQPTLISLYGESCGFQISSGKHDEIRLALSLNPRK